jgi:hypothetical protein
LQRLPGREGLASGMSKDQIGVPRSGQGGFRPHPVDASLLLGDFARGFGFGSMALLSFVLCPPSLRDQQPPIEQLPDGIGKGDVCLPLKQVVDGARDWQGETILEGAAKGVRISPRPYQATRG